MTDYYPIVEVQPEWVIEQEQMGSKEKFWYQQQDQNAWLFKYPRINTGEHWAEKITAEVAGLLGIRCSRVELAIFQGKPGLVTENIVPANCNLIHGNEVLENTIAVYEDRELNFHQADHTLENIWFALDKYFEPVGTALNPKTQFADYLILDAVVGNTDRHSENWGILQNKVSQHFIESLSPSYDHGSSLGRELTDERREQRLANNLVGHYVERGRGQIFRQGSRRKRPSPLRLACQAALDYPDLFRSAITKLDNLTETSLRRIVESVPEGWMTPKAREFTVELVQYSCHVLREDG